MTYYAAYYLKQLNKCIPLACLIGMCFITGINLLAMQDWIGFISAVIATAGSTGWLLSIRKKFKEDLEREFMRLEDNYP